jgi:predicted membrane protein
MLESGLAVKRQFVAKLCAINLVGNWAADLPQIAAWCRASHLPASPSAAVQGGTSGIAVALGWRLLHHHKSGLRQALGEVLGHQFRHGAVCAAVSSPAVIQERMPQRWR